MIRPTIEVEICRTCTETVQAKYAATSKTPRLCAEAQGRPQKMVVGFKHSKQSKLVYMSLPEVAKRESRAPNLF